MDIQQIQRSISDIQQRNKRVEIEKAWETSWTRRISIAVLTYLVISVFFFMSGVPQPWLNAIVPTFCFLLSTLSLSFIKKIWMKRLKIK